MVANVPSIPDGVVAGAKRLGPDGESWLAEVPALLGAAAERWGVELGYAVDTATAALVVRARRRQGFVVVKLWPPGDRFSRERAVLEAARGRGYVRLLDWDADRRALLLEPLGSDFDVAALQAGAGERGVHQVVASVLRQAWTVPVGCLPPTGPEDHPAERLRRSILDHPPTADVPDCGRAIARALSFAEQRLADHDPGRDVVVHGDPWYGNLRRVQTPRPGADSGYVFVNPLGLRCEREHDLGVLLRDGNRSLLAAADPVVLSRQWCAELAEDAGTDAEAIWQWAFLQRVARGLECLHCSSPISGRAYLQTAMALISRPRL